MKVESLFAEVSNLPNIPKVVQELIESFNDEDIDTEELASKIAMDQVLSAKVLRMANSAHFGVSRTIASMNDAVVLLGFNALRTLVLASGLSGAFKAPDGFDIENLWKTSFRTGAMCKWLAKNTKVNPETAFICGMLHNLGSVLLHLGVPTIAASIDKEVKSGAVRLELEISQIGVSYPQVGAELAVRWKFPEEISRAVGEHADPLAIAEFSALAGVVYVAKYLVECKAAALTEEEVIANFPTQIARASGIEPSQVFDKLEDTDDLGAEFDQLLN